MQRRIGLGILFGVFIAVGLSAYVVVAYLVTGGSVLAGYEVSLATVLVTYFVAGITGGFLVGILLPLYRTWYGAMLLGWIAVIPLYSIVVFAIAPAEVFDNISDVLIISGIVGPLVGFGMWATQKRTPFK